ncbi:hypothetical protein [Methanolobus sp. ZRKC5]|uniref:hypothetical protein n=1 Tax=Methanolobus sp. ZRKC5 TaxID=3136295 RepID=UPI00313E072C
MSGYRSVSLNNHLGDFVGEFVRVVTDKSHYRGECVRIDQKNNNVLLVNVVKKNETGWTELSERMLIVGHAIESVYIEKSFPFDSNESVILAIEDGSLQSDSNPAIKELGNLNELGFPEEQV